MGRDVGREMLLVVVLLTAATVLVIQTTDPAPWFSRVAQAFSGEGDLSALVRLRRVRWVYLAWADRLQSIGEMLALALTRVLRQTTY